MVAKIEIFLSLKLLNKQIGRYTQTKHSVLSIVKEYLVGYLIGM